MSHNSREVTCVCGHNDDEHRADDTCERCSCKQYLSQYEYDRLQNEPIATNDPEQFGGSDY